jgi:hypothetical protein
MTMETVWMALQRRRAEAASGTAVSAPMPSQGYWSKLADLCEWLSAVVWEDGTPRSTGTVMIFAEDGRWKAWLHDRDGSQSCFVSSDTLEGLLASTCKAAATAGGDWRPDKKGGRK